MTAWIDFLCAETFDQPVTVVSPCGNILYSNNAAKSCNEDKFNEKLIKMVLQSTITRPHGMVMEELVEQEKPPLDIPFKLYSWATCTNGQTPMVWFFGSDSKSEIFNSLSVINDYFQKLENRIYIQKGTPRAVLFLLEYLGNL